MKKLSSLLSIAVLGSVALSSVQAQELRLGGGYSGSIVDKSGTENWQGRAGYQFGVDVLLGNRFFLKPGIHMQFRNLNYTTVGVGQDGVPNGITTENRYTSKGIKIPILGGIRLIDPGTERDFNMYIVGGPSALIGLSTDQDDNTLSLPTRSTQWYLGFGAGLEYKFIFLDAGYDVGMSNVFKGDGVNTNPKVNNAYVAAGFRFLLKK